MGAPLLRPPHPPSEGGVRARVGVGVEDTVLAPESEFQLQAAYSPSPSPPPRQQSAGPSDPATQQGSSGRPRAVPASPGLLSPPPVLLPAVLWEILGGRCWWAHKRRSAFSVKTLLLSLVRSLQLPSETRHSFPDHLWPAFPEGLRGSQQHVVWGAGCQTDQPCADGNVLALLCPLWS